MGRPRKALISKRQTLEVALQICDNEGLEALSIRRLGRELNVQGISLYHHFKNKEEILIGVCELALADVRTPKSTDLHWREWVLHNALAYRKALLTHPNLIPILMKRHPLRIGLSEHNATAGLLAVQGVPPKAVMPILETIEELALGNASYKSAVFADEQADQWKTSYPYLYHLSMVADLDHEHLFEIVVRSAIDAIVDAVEAGEKKERTKPKAKKPKA